MAKQLNREGWLHRMAELQREWFSAHDMKIVGSITITMATIKKGFLGHCQSVWVEGEKRNHICVSAYENDHRSEINLAGTISHELLHAVLNQRFNRLSKLHGKEFKDGMDKLGLIGNATRALPGPELTTHLQALCDHLGPIPRFGVIRPPKITREPGDSSPRFQCPECKLTIQLTNYAYNLAGEPKCWNEGCDNYKGYMKLKVK